jgi:glucosamine--fructose-6-phosphate aminotransferase (isomerizing)
MKEMLEKLQALGAETLVITDCGNQEAALYRRAICLPVDLTEPSGKLPAEVYTPIPYIIPAQLLAARLAEAKGLDPDRPRTLSKVTRTL